MEGGMGGCLVRLEPPPVFVDFTTVQAWSRRDEIIIRSSDGFGALSELPADWRFLLEAAAERLLLDAAKVARDPGAVARDLVYWSALFRAGSSA